jgi:fluoride exporter
MILVKGVVFAVSLVGATIASLRVAVVTEKKLRRSDINKLMLYLLIALGSGIGGVTRAACAEVSLGLLGNAFPWGILIINAVGSFIIGFFFTATGPDGRWLVRSTTRQFVMTGFCGGYTTFSSFSLDTLNLIRDGRFGVAGTNEVLSLAVCLLSVWMGHTLAAELNSPGRRLSFEWRDRQRPDTK